MVYAAAVLVSFVVAGVIRWVEVKRLGYDRHPRHIAVSTGGMIGAIVGAKIGLVLFQPIGDWAEMVRGVLSFDFTGKTILGGLAGGYVGVEVIKRILGIRFSTGDGFAVALPVGMAIGRVGCFFHGCCYGVEWGGWRHPTPLYEGGLDLVLAGWLWAIRKRERPPGHLFRRFLVGYCVIRAALEPLRGDGAIELGPVTLVQVVCLAVAAIFTVLIVRGEVGWQADVGSDHG